MIGLSMIVGILIALLGVGMIANTFLPDDMIIALPLPRGNLGRILGVLVLVVGITVPVFGFSTYEPPPPPVTETPTSTPTLSPTPSVTPFPTIALVGTVTPFPTPRPTRGTQAPVQSLQQGLTPQAGV